MVTMINPFDLENIHKFLKGVDKFYTQFERRRTENKVIWQEGSTEVTEHGSKSKVSIFFIPSLINKSYILDLSEETSLVNYFITHGFKVYVINFTEPNDDESSMGFTDYQQRIIRAISDICGCNEVITIGYCLGGVFSCSIASSNKINIIQQILIATPWDLSHLNNPLVFNNFKLLMESMDKVPPAMIQLFFSYLAPTRIWNKFCQFSTLKEQSEIDKFLAIEQWINDGISLSKKFGLEAIEMITDNSLSKTTYLQICNIPSLIINGSEDNIAPIASSAPLYALLENKEIIVEKTGHIGLILSKLSQEKIWPKMLKFITNS